MSRIGISTACFYPMSVKDSLKTVTELGATVTEVFMNSFAEMKTENLRELKSIAEAGGTEIVSFHPFFSASDHLFLFSGYDFRVDDGIEIYRRFFDAAAYLGAKCLVFHGERLPQGADGISGLLEEKLYEVYSRLLNLAKESGVVLAQESVTAYRSQSTELIEFLKTHFADIRFAFDIKQILRSGKSPEKMLDAMGNRIVQVHLNNYTRSGECTLPFSDTDKKEGIADLTEIYSKLKALGYSGDYCIEVYRRNFEAPSEIALSLSRAKTAFGL